MNTKFAVIDYGSGVFELRAVSVTEKESPYKDWQKVSEEKMYNKKTGEIHYCNKSDCKKITPYFLAKMLNYYRRLYYNILPALEKSEVYFITLTTSEYLEYDNFKRYVYNFNKLINR